MRRRRGNPNGDGLPLIVGGVLVSGALFGGLLWWGSRSASSSSSKPSPAPAAGGPEPVGFFPDLKVGDMVEVDSARARIPVSADFLPVVICRVDMIMTDRTLVSVVGISFPFRGTISRDAIVRVLPPVAPGVFA